MYLNSYFCPSINWIIYVLTISDTTIAELIKEETDKKSFLEVIYAEQGL